MWPEAKAANAEPKLNVPIVKVARESFAPIAFALSGPMVETVVLIVKVHAQQSAISSTFAMGPFRTISSVFAIDVLVCLFIA